MTQSEPNSASTPKPGRTCLAWCGWQLVIPSDWEPQKIEGSYTKGRMFVGDARAPYMMVRWWRPALNGEKKFDFDAWLKTRFKKLHALPQENPPHSAGVDAAAWVKDLQKKEGMSRTIWYGYNKASDLVVEVLMTSLTPEDIRKQVTEEILPSLRIVTPDQPTPYSLYTVHFLAPPGFILEEHHLFSGDVALKFSKEKDVLVVRTVYPASLALTRRILKNWFKEPPFRESRRVGSFEISDWTSTDGSMKGLLRTGIKRLPIPLGWCNPRHSTAVAVVDEHLDRIRLADLQSPAAHEPTLVAQAVEDMNGGLAV